MKEGSPLLGLEDLAPGVKGYTIVRGDTVYLPMIEVQDEGKGKCQAYLESLEKQYKVVKVPNVLSGILLHILKKRGYKLSLEYSEEFQEMVEVWVKERR